MKKIAWLGDRVCFPHVLRPRVGGPSASPIYIYIYIYLNFTKNILLKFLIFYRRAVHYGNIKSITKEEATI